MNLLTIILIVIVAIVGYRWLTANTKHMQDSNLANALSRNLVTRVEASTLVTKIELAEQISEFKNVNESIELVDKLLAGSSK